jgi:putative ABC transport system permease protein
MVIINSIRQLLRTPMKTFFFFALLIFTITFFMLGYHLWTTATQNIDRIEDFFITIGTVEQKAVTVATHAMWDGETKSYMYFSHSVREGQIPVSVLDFEGAEYIIKPEKRPFYVAYDPGFIVDEHRFADISFDMDFLIVEMQPVADCVTSDPVRVTVKKVLMGNDNITGREVWFHNRYDETPRNLYEDKTYIVSLQSVPVLRGNDVVNEYIPSGIRTSQYTKEGKYLADTMPATVPWDEVTEGFYEAPRGRRWLARMDTIQKNKHLIPVVPTNATHLIMPFYDGTARVDTGRDITGEEYVSGEKVCLIPRYFAENNGLSVGDTLRLPLLYANYRSPASLYFDPAGGGGLITDLNADGEAYSVFEDGMYTIVGIYSAPAASAVTGYEMGRNEVVIPSASIEHSDEDNIVAVGPMKGYSTSFQIPNGQIEAYMAAWKAQGIDDLEINFYDKGYSKIKAGLDAVRHTAVLMFIVGAVTTLFAVILFCHLFITKQRKRTAIERSQGMSKTLCTVSLLVGILFILIPAYVFGSLASHLLADAALARVGTGGDREVYDTRYSDWVNNADVSVTSDVLDAAGGGAKRDLIGAAVIPVALLIGLAMVRGNLRSEPLKLLGERER